MLIRFSHEQCDRKLDRAHAALRKAMENIQTLKAEIRDGEKNDEQIIKERDDAQEAISHAYYLVTGRSPEWSNLFGYKEALEEIEDACYILRDAAKKSAATIHPNR
jgi:hypothetical protein